MFAREIKRLSLGGFIPFCYKFVIQIFFVQTFNFSAETLLQKLPNKKVSFKHRKRPKEMSGCHCNLFLYLDLSKNQKPLKQYQHLVKFTR